MKYVQLTLDGNTASITAVADGTSEITVECDGKQVIAKINVESVLDYNYVLYDVEYTDIYSGTRFTKNTAWRLLNQTDNGDGTYDIDIISTGILVGLYYNGGTITQSSWRGTLAEREKIVEQYQISDTTVDYNNVYAASGLKYHFDLIEFKQQSGEDTMNNNEDNIGYYTSIKSNGQELSGSITGKSFIALDNATVRALDKSDFGILDSSSDEKGLLYLVNYSLDYYPKEFWTCMPDVGRTPYHLTYGSSTSSVFRTATSGCSGLRPIVSIQGVKMEKSGNTWEIKD